MESYLGLPLKKAEAEAKAMGFKVKIIRSNAKDGVTDADTEIVIRQRQQEEVLELVVSAFKTKLF